MKKLGIAMLLLISVAGFSQNKYFKDKKGNIITEAEYDKVVSELMQAAIDSKKEGENLEFKTDLKLVKQTKDSLVFDYSVNFTSGVGILNEPTKLKSSAKKKK